tara:strand:+ start:2631 stop:2864 length:234 start_codon:yes stop_codon:yes gene_type:complete
VIVIELKKEINMNHKLSNQAIGAIMMALQKSLMEQSDIVPVLRGFQVQVDDSGELVVMNAPAVQAPKAKPVILTGDE